MRLWHTFYNDDMKGIPIGDTLAWCNPEEHDKIPVITCQDRFMALSYNDCIERGFPLPQELVNWWEETKKRFGGGWTGFTKMRRELHLSTWYADDWNADRGGKRWNK